MFSLRRVLVVYSFVLFSIAVVEMPALQPLIPSVHATEGGEGGGGGESGGGGSISTGGDSGGGMYGSRRGHDTVRVAASANTVLASCKLKTTARPRVALTLADRDCLCKMQKLVIRRTDLSAIVQWFADFLSEKMNIRSKSVLQIIGDIHQCPQSRY